MKGKSPARPHIWTVSLKPETAELLETLRVEIGYSKSQVCADLITLILRGPEAAGPRIRYLIQAMDRLGIDHKGNINAPIED